MKPENNDLNKAAFFAVYWGQNCICNDEYVWRSNETFDTVLSIYNGDFSGWYARLTPLSKITDENLVAIAKIEGVGVHGAEIENIQPFTRKLSFDSSIRGVRFEYADRVFELLFNKYRFWKMEGAHSRREISLFNAIEVIDFLRSRSYLLPWMGLTPDELISYGWVKYKEG